MNAVLHLLRARLVVNPFPLASQTLKVVIRLASVLTLALVALESARADNIAPQGIGILGVNNAVDSDAGTPRANAGTIVAINDNSLSTRVDNWWGNGVTDMGQSVSFVGVRWPSVRHEDFLAVTLTLAVFGDGGWFGVPGAPAPTGGALAVTNLVEPVVQVTSDGGATWTTVAASSDYLTAMTGLQVGGTGGAPNPNSRTIEIFLDVAVTAINGIRVIGSNGGRAGADANGFLGVFELAVEGVVVDSDADGMDDSWETANGLVVGVDESAADPDGDGLTNVGEHAANTNPNSADTDGDGLTDGAEISTHLTKPLLADTDNDGLSDGAEINTHLTNALLADSDTDGLSDGAEVNTHHTNPLNRDSDGDSFSDSVEVARGSNPNNPNNFPNNLALIGTGVIGTRSSLAVGPDVPYVHSGVATSINDESLTTRVDTWNSTTPGTVSYVGITWPGALTVPVLTLDLTLATFFDGGWFGVNGTGPAAGGPLTAAHLVEPTTQISMDSGVTWVDVPHTSDYITALTGHLVGGGGVPNPSTVAAKFTLSAAANGISGIRIIGTDGGAASGGFLGVFELSVRTSVTDSDNDGMDDSWEALNGLNVGSNDAAADPDVDALTNIGEFTSQTNPQVPDTDGDGLLDGEEVNVYNTHPLRTDTDADGLADGPEVVSYHTNPLVKDSDGDGFFDGAEVTEGSRPDIAASFPLNFALIGTGILGTKDAVDGTPGTPVFNAGGAASINDANLTTRVDTYNGGNPGTVSFVGITWAAPLAYPVVTLELNLATFFDGGWFGVNGIGPGAGGALAPTDLVEPEVQITTDGGATWTPVGHTSDYLTALNGHLLPAVAFGPPTLATATFRLNTPQTNINGIRIIGTEGGTASGGFLGIFELKTTVHAIQPAIISNIALTGGQISFEFISQEGFTHQVEFKDSFADANWQNLTTISGDGSVKVVTDAAGGTQRIYRVSTQ